MIEKIERELEDTENSLVFRKKAYIIFEQMKAEGHPLNHLVEAFMDYIAKQTMGVEKSLSQLSKEILDFTDLLEDSVMRYFNM